MLTKLKNALKDDENEQVKKKVDISVLNGEQVKIYKKIIERFKENVQSIEELSRTNHHQLLEYIKQRREKPQENGQVDEAEQHYNFEDDMKEIKETLQEIFTQLKQLQAIENTIKQKVQSIEGSQSPQSTKELQNQIAKYESQLKALSTSEQNNKQILNTLRQQSQLYSKEMKELQEKSMKLEKQLNEKNSLINNLKDQKVVLLEMRNSDSSAQIPQVQALKKKLLEAEKRLTLQKTRIEQKEKQIQNLKKRMQQDRQSLQKIADELKQKQLKSKKVIDKYERSKTQIRKFREEKTEFIKKLNMEVADLNEKLKKEIQMRSKGDKQTIELTQQIEELKTEVSKNQNRKVQLESVTNEMIQIRKELHERNVQLEEHKGEYVKLKKVNQELQAKRKQLLQALEKPINHQLRTLQKIIRALDKLYKEYIVTVFQEGNIVGFQSKITYILSNVQQIKQDLLL